MPTSPRDDNRSAPSVSMALSRRTGGRAGKMRLQYLAVKPGLLVYDAHRDDLGLWSRGLAWARMQRQTQETACDAITTWRGSRRGPLILPTTPWSPGPRHSPLL